MGARLADAVKAFNQLDEELRSITLASLGLKRLDLTSATTEFTWLFVRAVQEASGPVVVSDREEEEEEERDSFEASDNSEILLYEKHDARFDFDRADAAAETTRKRVNRQFSSKQEAEAGVVDLSKARNLGSSRDYDEMVLYLRALQRDGWEACLQSHPKINDVLKLIIKAWGRDTNEKLAREAVMALLTSDNIVITARSGRTRDVCVFCGDVRSCDYNVAKLGGPAGVYCVGLAKALQAWSDAMIEAGKQVDDQCSNKTWRADTYRTLYRLEEQILQRHQDKGESGGAKKPDAGKKKKRKQEDDDEDE